MLVSSRGMVLKERLVFFLSSMSVMTCTCCRPVMDSPLMCVTRYSDLSPASHAWLFLSTDCKEGLEREREKQRNEYYVSWVTTALDYFLLHLTLKSFNLTVSRE